MFFKCCSSNFSSGDKAQGEVDDISLRCKWLWLLFLIDEYFQFGVGCNYTLIIVYLYNILFILLNNPTKMTDCTFNMQHIFVAFLLQH